MNDAISNELVLASSNQGKHKEFSILLGQRGFILKPQSDWNVPEAVEDAPTFLENALIKARNASAHTGLPSLADDSGLVVQGLAGAPGIFSARYAGDEGDDKANNRKLLSALEGLTGTDRAAYFHCVIVLTRSVDDPVPLVASANWYGEIALTESGIGGFGYDPVFLVNGMNCTSAELSPEQKGLLSHRGQAVRKLLSKLDRLNGC